MYTYPRVVLHGIFQQKSECPWHYGIQTGATCRKRKRYVIDWGTQSKSDKWVLKM